MNELSTTPVVMAHRGGRLGGDPNTVEAIAHACDVGAGSAEIDVNETADGVLLATHDSVVSENSWVSEHTFDDLVAMNAAEWGRRRLEDVVDYTLARSAVAYLDLKSITPTGLKYIAHRWPEAMADRRLVFASARGDVVAWIGDHIEGAATSFLYYDRLLDITSLAPYLSLTYIHPCFDHVRQPFRTLTEQYVDRARSLGYGLVSWSENDSERIARMGALGLDFVCTDEPELAATTLGRLDT